MKLVGRIPVEPLDDERLTNIERRIVAGAADAAARQQVATQGWLQPGLVVALVAMLVVVAGAIGWQLHAPAKEPVVAEAPLEIRTDRDRSTIDIGDATIASDPASAFAITRPDGGVLVAMTRGKVELSVGKRGERPPLIVRAGDTDVVVIGTKFSVDFGDGKGDVDVRVTEGVVKVRHQQQETRVAAGSGWTSKTNAVVALAEMPVATVAGARGTPGAKDVEIDMGDAPDVLHKRTAAVPESHGATTQPVRPTTQPARPDTATTQPRSERATGDLKALIRGASVAPALEVDGVTDGNALIEKYQEIMRGPKGALEAHAFYSMAMVQYAKLGKPERALDTLQAFIPRSVRTEYEVPALWLVVRIKCLRALDGECRQAADAYLRRAPDGPAHDIAERIVGK